MYICICNQVSDKQIKVAIDNGANTVDDLQVELGVASQCGQCRNCAKTLINEYSATRSACQRPTPQQAPTEIFPFFINTAAASE